MLTKNIKILPKIALFSGVAVILSFIKIPIFFVPGFYTLEFSDAVALIGSLLFGPVTGVTILLLKNVLLYFVKGTQTLAIGSLANFVLGICFILPYSLIYRKNKSRKGFVLAFFTSILIESFTSLLLNFYVFLPLYASLLSVNANSFFAGQAVPLSANPLFMFIIFCVLPFNLFKYSCNCAAAVIIYKKVVKFLFKRL